MNPHPVILVVDSHEVFNMMQPMLKKALDEPQLVHCPSRQDAMHYVDSDKFADFIFADWDLTGYRFMDSVRSDPENHNTPVVIMSEDTTNKKIVLNSITSEATFFLAKPFLQKGLVKKYQKAVAAVERRRRQRIHPGQTYLLPVVFDHIQHHRLPLVDISIDGCLLRAPLTICDQLRIYQHARITLSIEEFDIRAEGEVSRIGQDRNQPARRDQVLVMVRFNASSKQDRKVQDLLDSLAQRW